MDENAVKKNELWHQIRHLKKKVECQKQHIKELEEADEEREDKFEKIEKEVRKLEKEVQYLKGERTELKEKLEGREISEEELRVKDKEIRKLKKEMAELTENLAESKAKNKELHKVLEEFKEGDDKERGSKIDKSIQTDEKASDDEEIPLLKMGNKKANRYNYIVFNAGRQHNFQHDMELSLCEAFGRQCSIFEDDQGDELTHGIDSSFPSDDQTLVPPIDEGRDSGIGCENEQKDEDDEGKTEEETEGKKADEREEEHVVGILFALLFTGTFVLVKFFNGQFTGSL